MKFQLDENFGSRTQTLIRASGYDVETVRDEQLQGSPDQTLFHVCCTEKRCLITLDLDFSDPVRFPPELSTGIVIIRVPKNPSLGLLERLIRQLLHQINQTPIQNELWIVEINRIRIHQSKE